ncbi:glycosyltransferase [Galbibacter mesophilus]|uniref:glycosyltransferase n=1 Tax=Galbibacter mesophilus TaxID=379069 RepID=UPI00191EE331|nr:glycosyltransferase [Galbibacter mesophilus]MCM5663417.1 glycosyltransferase [Galbibacter mesophilus]
MKRILLIVPYGSVGGMERLAFSFYTFLKAKGHYVKALKLMKLDNDIIHFGGDELFLSKKDFHEMTKSQRASFYINSIFKLRSLIKKHKITHSISFGALPNIFSSLTFTKDCKIASIHALKSVELSNPSTLSKLTKLAYTSSYKNLDKVVCISNAIKKDLIENCNFKFEDKLEVIYNPHNFIEIETKAELPITSVDELALFNSPTILFVGRLSAQKSPWHIINAFNFVVKENPETKLIFIGDGDMRIQEYLEKLIKDYGLEQNIFFLGRKSNPYQYLSKADVLILASHYEGTPNVIVEAICLETPVVSSCCTDGIIELMSLKNINAPTKSFTEVEGGIITPNLFRGKLGIPTTNDAQYEEKILANALLHALKSDNIKERIRKNKSRLLEKFDIEKVVDSYLKEV